MSSTDTTTGAMTRTERKRLATHEQLLSAGRELGMAGGWESIVVEDVAELADVSPATFYNHFGSRDAFFDELGVTARDRMLDLVERSLTGSRPPHHELASLTKALVESADSESRRSRFGLSVSDNVVATPGPIDALHALTIHRGQESGIFDVDVDMDLAVIMYRAAVREAMRYGSSIADEGWPSGLPWKYVVSTSLAFLGADSEAVSDAVTAASTL